MQSQHPPPDEPELAGHPGEESNLDATGQRLQEIQRRERRIAEAVRLALGVGIVLGAFFVATLFLQNADRAALQKAQDVQTAIKGGASTAGGLLVYSPSAKAQDQVALAFDGSSAPSSFWETKFFPIVLIVVLPQARSVNSYAMTAGELASRMPRSWTVEASSDGANWHTVDVQSGVPDWHPGEARTYPLKATAPVRALRFEFREGSDQEILRIYEIRLGS